MNYKITLYGRFTLDEIIVKKRFLIYRLIGGDITLGEIESFNKINEQATWRII